MTESFVAALKATIGESVFVQAVVRLIGAMRVRPRALPPEVVAADLAALRGLFAGSVLASAIADRVGRIAGARGGSRATRAVSNWIDEMKALEAWQMIRAAGLAGLTAAATVALFALVDPRPASGYRWWLWAVAVGVSAAAALGARALAEARGGSQLLRRR